MNAWAMTLEEYRKAFPATRNLQHFDHETRAMHRSSHRLGYRQRERIGEYFYTHPDAPGLAFPTHGAAVEAGYRNVLKAAAEAGEEIPMHALASLPEARA